MGYDPLPQPTSVAEKVVHCRRSCVRHCAGEIARNSVESERPSELIGYATATPFAIGFLERVASLAWHGKLPSPHHLSGVEKQGDDRIAYRIVGRAIGLTAAMPAADQLPCAL